MMATWTELEAGVLKEATDAYLLRMLEDLPDDKTLKRKVKVSKNLNKRCYAAMDGTVCETPKVVFYHRRTFRYLVVAAFLAALVALSSVMADPYETERFGNCILVHNKGNMDYSYDIPQPLPGQPVKSLNISFENLPYDMVLVNTFVSNHGKGSKSMQYESPDGRHSMMVSVILDNSKTGGINTERCEILRDSFPQFDQSLYIGNDKQQTLFFVYQGVEGQLLYVGTKNEFTQILDGMRFEVYDVEPDEEW